MKTNEEIAGECVDEIITGHAQGKDQMNAQEKEIIERLIVHTSRDDILKGYYSAEIESDMAKARAMLDSGGWIKCSERMPEKNGFYAVAWNGCKAGAYFDANRCEWDSISIGFKNVTYWQPLPEPPKEEAK